MKTNLVIPVGGLLKIITKDGKTLNNDQIRSIEVEPFFATSNGQAELLHAETTLEDGTPVDKFTLLVSGTNGKSARRDRVDKSAVPMIEKKKTTTVASSPPDSHPTKVNKP